MLADRLGYREAFIGEHLVDAAETITSSLAFIASLADACPSITFGTGVLPLANYHPAMAAAQVAMVDHLVQGRLVLGVGPGVPGDAEASETWARTATARPRRRSSTCAGSGAKSRRTGSKASSTGPPRSARSIRRSGWASQSARCKGRIRPSPSPRSARTAGDRTRRELAAGPGSRRRYVGAYVVRAQIESYLEGRRSAGLSADASGWRVARSVFVADDETTARRYAHREDGAHGFYFHVMRTKLAKAGALDVMRDFPDQPDSELSTKRCLERLVIAGTPESVADQILAFRNEVGAFGTLLYTGHDWADPALARRSMELMANEVWPRIDRAVHGTTPREQSGGKVYSD